MERAAPPPGIFVFNGDSPFITATSIAYLQTIPAGQRWVDMVSSFLRMEEFPVTKGVSLYALYLFSILTSFSQSPMRLASAKLRPDEISTWMKARSYKLDQIPFISDVGLYFKKWSTWWTLCQPAWRQGKGWPLPTNDPDGTDLSIKAISRGQNGLFLVVVSTAWWASSIRSTKDWDEFDEVVKDVQWVIDQGAKLLKAISVPVSPVCSDPPQDPAPAPGATWMAREDGKRRPKPSRRLLEGGGIGGR